MLTHIASFAAILFMTLLSPSAWAQESAAWVEMPEASLLVPESDDPQASVSSYLVGAGDELAWQVYGEPELAGQVVVSSQGTINLPLLGEIRVEHMTPDGIARHLEQLLEREYLVDPHVNVTVVLYQSQPVQVLGAVKNPGVFHLTRPTTLLEMLALAGGVISQNSIREVHIKRDGDGSTEPIVVNLDRLLANAEGNIELRAGDVVHIPEGVVVYVAGQVEKPGVVPYQDGITLTQALTGAGGPTTSAKLREVYILRDGERMVLNLKRIIQGRDADVALEPGDQVFLEQSVF